MKFKSLFLGMLGAAVMFSCNNEIDPNPGPDGGKDVVEGLPIYATMTLNAAKAASTYAGGSDVTAQPRETTVGDVAMYIYKSDAAGFIPQCAVYLGSLPSSNKVTMRTTSGTKKIFVAANPRSNPTNTAMTDVTGLSAVSTDIPLNFLLNDTLYSTSATAFGKGSFATPAKTKADGLIVNFAMGSIYGSGLADNSAYSSSTSNPLMTNWDGPIDADDAGGSASPFDGNATFTLDGDIDSVSSESHAKNHITINVQRQYAKISLKFNPSIVKTTGVTVSVPSGLSNQAFAAAPGDKQEGRFIPWGATTNMYWSLGNIATAQVPFQQFDEYDGVTIRDVFYKLTNDSLKNAGHFNTWTQHYDNTRVFPMATLTSYPMPGLKVSDVKTNMLVTTNRTTMTPENATILGGAGSTYNYAYATENARQHPVLKDHQTYAIVGGFYQPKLVYKDYERKAVAANGIENYITADNFTWVPATADTLYYHATDQVFIVGEKTLLAYYAWVKKKQYMAGGEPGGTVFASSLNLSDFNSDVTDAINADMGNDVLYRYFEGQCWYRIFLVNTKTTPEKQVIVARNHIYDITIDKLKGPGISDPNKIIIPGEPVIEQDTYVSATITPLDWHRVEQGVEVDNK